MSLFPPIVASPAPGRRLRDGSRGHPEPGEDDGLQQEPGGEDAEQDEELHQITCSTPQTIIFIRFMHASQ